MPGKRKRDEPDQGRHSTQRAHAAGNKQIVEAKIHHGKQLLSRALKLAKGFERQKLSRRLKNAEKEKKDADVQRINAEIEALKLLDLHAASEIHIHKAILKEKALRESPLLPPQIPEKAKVNLNNATANITARLWASAPVKKVMVELMAPIRKALVGHDAARLLESRPAHTHVTDAVEAPDAVHDRLIADSEDDGDNDDDEEEENEAEERNRETEDDGDFTAFDDRVGASSDDESLDLEAAKANAANRRAVDLSLSPSPSRTDESDSPLDDEESQSSALESDTHSEQDDDNAAPSKPRATKLASTRDLFLPSLTSGYISASDESASDLDADAASTRKNRRGQRARQKIWEAKYGAKAKHVETAAKKGGGRDQGWDMKRGARAEGEDARFRGRGRGGFGSSGRRVTTGANGEEVVPRSGRAVAASRGGGQAAAPNRAERRAGGDKQKEKQAPLHPSWEAARRAKETKAASVGFAGTKVTFD